MIIHFRSLRDGFHGYYNYIMIDKGKYASHGAFIKRLNKSAMVHWDKPKLAIIHPVPSAKAREAQINDQMQGVQLQSKTFSAKFRFQSNVDRKPVSQEFSQPFLYIEKVIKKQTVQKKLSQVKKYDPFVTTVNPKKTKNAKNAPKPPQGYKSLYDYEEERRKIATKVFEKMVESEVHNLKDMFLLWYGKSRKVTPQIDVKEQEFIDFFKEILPGKLSEKQMRHFFELYKNKAPQGKEKDEQFRVISIKALSFNFQKFRKAQLQVANLMSEKAVKERYMSLKDYSIQFNNNYPQLKQAMKSIKNYEQSLKRHFKELYESYRNPYEDEISSLKRQLQKPIIKYDKFKKQELLGKIEQLTAKNQQMHSKLTQNYQTFIANYEEAIMTNHDLFFTKRILNKLLLPLLDNHPYLTRALIEQQVGQQQQKKQRYLQCLSEMVVQIDRDKKHLAQDCFTLDEIVQMMLIHSRKKDAKFDQQWTLYSVKKLVKEIKKQFLLKYQLIVQSMDQFPSDQEIPLELLHTCFEMECTKVLFKNQIWNQLLQWIPAESEQRSKYHQRTIDANLCLQFVNRYFHKLDQRMKIEMNKSKHISLLAENVSLNDFESCASIISGVLNKLDDYIEDDEEQADQVEPLQPQKKKVTFADVADMAISKNNFPEKFNEENTRKEQEMQMVKSLLKSIFEEEPKKTQQLPQIKVTQGQSQYQQGQSVFGKRQVEGMGQNLNQMNTLAKSFFVPQGLNTNSFDIRYYEKVKANEQLNRSNQPQVVRMGSSVLLTNVPHVQEIRSDDPLRISRFLMTNIDKGVKQQHKVVHQKMYESSIKEGVDHNYFKDKIKLQNKPTVYDSEGKSKYSVLLPVGYYESFVAAQNAPDQQKWYLRPHHVQTLTENPLSKKDNVIHTEYQSKLDKLPLKKRPDEYVIEENVKRKEELINSLQQRISVLKNDLQGAQRGSRVEGVKVPTTVVNNYLSKLTEGKEDKDLEIATYQGVLYDLRRKQRDLLVAYRQHESEVMGEPEEKWWQRKDKSFNNELRKDRMLLADSLKPESKHRQYVQKLKNNEIY